MSDVDGIGHRQKTWALSTGTLSDARFIVGAEAFSSQTILSLASPTLNPLDDPTSLGPHLHSRGRKTDGCHIPLKVVLLLVFFAFAAIPSVVLWQVSWKVWENGINEVNANGRQSVEGFSDELSEHLISRAKQYLESLNDRIGAIVGMYLNRIALSGVLQRDGRSAFREGAQPISLASPALKPLVAYLLPIMKSHFRMSTVTFSMKANDNIFGSIQRTLMYSHMNYDTQTQTSADTTYLTDITLFNSLNVSTMDIYRVDDQTFATGPRLPLNYPALLAPVHEIDLSSYTFCYRSSDVSFVFPTGTPEVIVGCQVAFTDRQAAIQFEFHVGIASVSVLLQSFLTAPKDRMFYMYRNPRGVLFGASAGSIFSHSDMNFSQINPLLNPSVIAQFQTFSALNSSDPVIRAAGVSLFRQYGSWEAIPELNTMQYLNGEQYWISSRFIPYKFGDDIHLFMLAHRETRMGMIDRSMNSTIADIRSNNRHLTVILCMVVAAGVGLAVLLSYVVSHSLTRLTNGLDRLCALKFIALDENSAPVSRVRLQPKGSKGKGTSIFQEIASCEEAFARTERGLTGFAKYVPAEIVRLIFDGEMRLDSATQRVLTVLIMDIAKFSTFCEAISIDQLVEFTSEYLQNMCEIIVGTGGSLDKFIGDCIMALWNAPRRVKGHAGCACRAAIDMQSRLLELMESHTDLPPVRFRIGINTDRLYVGNFGCRYRIAFTCIGNGLFQTVILVHPRTKEMAEADFHFRKLSHLSFTGDSVSVREFLNHCGPPASNPAEDETPNSEYSAVYELLCDREVVSIAPSSICTTAHFLRNPTTSTTNENVRESSGGDTMSSPSSTPNPVHQPSPPIIALPLTFGGNREAHYLSVNATTHGGQDSPPNSIHRGDQIVFHWEHLQRSLVLDMVDLYQKGLDCLHRPEGIRTAMRYFAEAVALVPIDDAARQMLTRCEEGLEQLNH